MVSKLIYFSCKKWRDCLNLYWNLWELGVGLIFVWIINFFCGSNGKIFFSCILDVL